MFSGAIGTEFINPFMGIGIFIFASSLFAALFLDPTHVRHGVVKCIHNHISEIASYVSSA